MVVRKTCNSKMRVLGIDFESTGLEIGTDKIVEMGVCLWDVEGKRPLVTVGVFLYDESYPPIKADAFKTHGISLEMLKEFGTSPKQNLTWLEGFVRDHKPDVACGHNGTAFDKPLLMHELKALGITAPHLEALHWLDTRMDIPVKGESTKLKYMAADHGFVNPFAHRAVFDVMTMLQVLSNYDLDEVVRTSKVPLVRLEARMVFKDPQFNAKKDLVKKNKYIWDSEKTVWWKMVREPDVEAEMKTVPFAQIKI